MELELKKVKFDDYQDYLHQLSQPLEDFELYWYHITEEPRGWHDIENYQFPKGTCFVMFVCFLAFCVEIVFYSKNFSSLDSKRHNSHRYRQGKWTGIYPKLLFVNPSSYLTHSSAVDTIV